MPLFPTSKRPNHTLPSLLPIVPTRPATANRTRALALLSAYRVLLASEIPKKFGVVFGICDKINENMLREAGTAALQKGEAYRRDHGVLFGMQSERAVPDPDKVGKVLIGAQRLQLLSTDFDARWGPRANLLLMDGVDPDIAIASDEAEWGKVLEFAKRRGHDVVTKGATYGQP